MSELLDRLTGRLRAETGLVTAFSGGADSALLAAAAHLALGARTLAGLRSGSMNLLVDRSRGHTMPGDRP
jgi:PP-loop superfamily ATP-utilizing enzyme